METRILVQTLETPTETTGSPSEGTGQICGTFSLRRPPSPHRCLVFFSHPPPFRSVTRWWSLRFVSPRSETPAAWRQGERALIRPTALRRPPRAPPPSTASPLFRAGWPTAPPAPPALPPSGLRRLPRVAAGSTSAASLESQGSPPPSSQGHGAAQQCRRPPPKWQESGSSKWIVFWHFRWFG